MKRSILLSIVMAFLCFDAVAQKAVAKKAAAPKNNNWPVSGISLQCSVNFEPE
jgi:hypothetical protein